MPEISPLTGSSCDVSAFSFPFDLRLDEALDSAKLPCAFLSNAALRGLCAEVPSFDLEQNNNYIDA